MGEEQRGTRTEPRAKRHQTESGGGGRGAGPSGERAVVWGPALLTALVFLLRRRRDSGERER